MSGYDSGTLSIRTAICIGLDTVLGPLLCRKKKKNYPWNDTSFNQDTLNHLMKVHNRDWGSTIGPSYHSQSFNSCKSWKKLCVASLPCWSSTGCQFCSSNWWGMGHSMRTMYSIWACFIGPCMYGSFTIVASLVLGKRERDSGFISCKEQGRGGGGGKFQFRGWTST